MAASQVSSGSLKSLKREDQVRKRPGVIFGTNDEYGAAHGIEEVLANSVDEAREGYGDTILFSIDENGVVDIEDDGRGLPMDYNASEGKWDWELALCTLYASGKYDSSNYMDSTGLNGLGLTATQFASEFMEVWSTYGGKTRYMQFKKGVPVGDMQVLEPVKSGTGTRIRFKPDVEVFPALRTVTLPADYFINIIRKLTVVQDGLTIKFSHPDLPKELVMCYKEGIVEFIGKITQKPLLENVVYYTSSEYGTDDPVSNPEKYNLNMRLAFTFSKETKFIEVYHNGSHMFELADNHTLEALKSAFTNAFTDYAKYNGKIGKNDKFLFKDIEPILTCIATTRAPGNRTWFKNQTKGAITNPFIKQSLYTFIYNSLVNWLNINKTVTDKVVTEVLTFKELREEYTKSINKATKQLSKGISFGNKPALFKDCITKDRSKKEIYFVEGRSALGSVLTARLEEFQAIFPLRGKPINALKEKLTRVLSNDIIIDIFRLCECGIEVKNEHIENLPEFDITKLAWDKLIICTDADVDGMHIRCLMIALFYVLAPSLLKHGKVYIAETPLFEISWKDETKFAYTEEEKTQVLQEFYDMGATPNKIKIQRSKGLGENDADMMNVSTMNPLTRRLVRVDYPENDKNVANYFNALLGDDIETRRILIDEYFDITESA